MREVLEKRMTGLLHGLKTGTKQVTEVLPTLTLLKKNFAPIAEEYEKKYIEILAARKLAA